MISTETALKIHELSIKKFGGSFGIVELGKLESALARPFQSFGGTEFYDTIFKKASALGESIIKNHPFVDGNKRTGYLLMEALLRTKGYKINTSDEGLYDFVIDIATSKLTFEEIVKWLENNSVKI